MATFYQPGRYRCLVTDQAFMTAKTGKPMIVFKVRPEGTVLERLGDDGEVYTEEEGTAQQYERTVRLVINESDQESLDFAMRKLRFAGFEGTTFDELNLRGESILCDCEHGSYQGQPKEDWNLALPRRKSAPLQNEETLPRRLNAIFGRKLTDGATAKTAAAPVAVAAGGGAADDDDIPF